MCDSTPPVVGVIEVETLWATYVFRSLREGMLLLETHREDISRIRSMFLCTAQVFGASSESS